MKQCCGKSALKIILGSLTFLALLFIGLVIGVTFLVGVIIYFTINQFRKCIKIVYKYSNPII